MVVGHWALGMCGRVVCTHHLVWWGSHFREGHSSPALCFNLCGSAEGIGGDLQAMGCPLLILPRDLFIHIGALVGGRARHAMFSACKTTRGVFGLVVASNQHIEEDVRLLNIGLGHCVNTLCTIIGREWFRTSEKSIEDSDEGMLLKFSIHQFSCGFFDKCSYQSYGRMENRRQLVEFGSDGVSLSSPAPAEQFVGDQVILVGCVVPGIQCNPFSLHSYGGGSYWCAAMVKQLVQSGPASVYKWEMHVTWKVPSGLRRAIVALFVIDTDMDCYPFHWAGGRVRVQLPSQMSRFFPAGSFSGDHRGWWRELVFHNGFIMFQWCLTIVQSSNIPRVVFARLGVAPLPPRKFKAWVQVWGDNEDRVQEKAGHCTGCGGMCLWLGFCRRRRGVGVCHVRHCNLEIQG